MGYKIQTALKKNRKSFIIIFILWLIIAIVFIAPLSFSIVESMKNGSFDFATFFEVTGSSVMSPFSTLGKVFSDQYIGLFGQIVGIFTVLFFFVSIIGIIRAMPKNEYANIEHGSSSWCEHGEQYKVLSNKKGILLAEEHYLPVTKRGNINVLVVGRIWFW